MFEFDPTFRDYNSCFAFDKDGLRGTSQIKNCRYRWVPGTSQTKMFVYRWVPDTQMPPDRIEKIVPDFSLNRFSENLFL